MLIRLPLLRSCAPNLPSENGRRLTNAGSPWPGNTFWVDFQCILNGFRMDFECISNVASIVLGWIPMHFRLISNGIWNEFQLMLEGIVDGCQCFVYGFQCILNGFRLLWEGLQCIFNWFSIGFGSISMGLAIISMRVQLIFNGIWKEFQLGSEGISIACGWMSLLLRWISMHLG